VFIFRVSDGIYMNLKQHAFAGLIYIRKTDWHHLIYVYIIYIIYVYRRFFTCVGLTDITSHV